MVDTPRSDRKLLIDILRFAREAHETAQDIDLSWEKFKTSHIHQNAIIRCIEVIGEASNKISSNIKKALPEIPWDDVYGMRNTLIHGYGGVELEEVWQTVTEDIPSLIDTLESFLSAEDAPD